MALLKNIRNSNRNRPPGFSLTEMAIVLGVVGLVSGAIWVVAMQVRLANQVRTTTQQLIAIAQNIRTLFAERGSVAGQAAALTPAADQLQVFPLDMRQDPAAAVGILFNVWDSTVTGGLGTVQVFASDCTGVSGATVEPCFSVEYYNVPQGACTRLLVAISQPGQGLQEIITADKGDVGDAAAGTLPVVASKAAAACASNPEPSVQWVYLLRNNT